MSSKRVKRQYNWSTITPTAAVLESLAVFEHNDPNMMDEVLDPPLDKFLNTNALDTIATSETPVTIEFSTPNYQIQIHENTITVTATTEPPTLPDNTPQT